MSETHLQKLFKIDEKISSAGTRNEEGSGLGLILCKEMLVLMNSDLKVDSTVSEGSKFYFTLPLVN
jgi:signal transduction histidine kinase